MTSPGLLRALNRSIKEAELMGPLDAAAVAFARHYARLIDDGKPLHNIGGQFRELLIELGLTPKARAALAKGEPQQLAGANALASLRDEVGERRAAKALGDV